MVSIDAAARLKRHANHDHDHSNHDHDHLDHKAESGDEVNLYLWPSAVVPYEIESNVDSNAKIQLIEAMRQIEDQTRIGQRDCIRFVPRKYNIPWLCIHASQKCFAEVSDLYLF